MMRCLFTRAWKPGARTTHPAPGWGRGWRRGLVLASVERSVLLASESVLASVLASMQRAVLASVLASVRRRAVAGVGDTSRPESLLSSVPAPALVLVSPAAPRSPAAPSVPASVLESGEENPQENYESTTSPQGTKLGRPKVTVTPIYSGTGPRGWGLRPRRRAQAWGMTGGEGDFWPPQHQEAPGGEACRTTRSTRLTTRST